MAYDGLPATTQYRILVRGQADGAGRRAGRPRRRLGSRAMNGALIHASRVRWRACRARSSPPRALLAGCADDVAKPTPLEPLEAKIAGHEVWKLSLGGVGSFSALAGNAGFGPQGMAVAGNNFVIGALNGALVSVDADTGKENWRADAGGRAVHRHRQRRPLQRGRHARRRPGDAGRRQDRLAPAPGQRRRHRAVRGRRARVRAGRRPLGAGLRRGRRQEAVGLRARRATR